MGNPSPATALKAASFTLFDLAAAGFSVPLGATLPLLSAAGCGVADLRAAGFTAAELKAVDFKAAELKAGGFAPRALIAGGFKGLGLQASTRDISGNDLPNTGPWIESPEPAHVVGGTGVCLQSATEI